MKNKKTVFVGIPAHNEGSNISSLLNSLLAQRASNYTLERIVVACDGCTDNTAAIVRDYANKHKIIRLMDDGKRKGQAERLNYFYRTCDADIFLTFDADVSLKTDDVIENMVEQFDNPDVGLVGGYDIPCEPKGFVEKIIVARILFWHKASKHLRSGNTVHNHPGRASALSREAYRKIEIPKEIIANDDYLYFRNLQLGYKFRFARKAIVLYKAPANIEDYLTQFSRFIYSEGKIQAHFGDVAIQEYGIPLKEKIRAFMEMFVKKPLTMTGVIVFNFMLKLMIPFYKRRNNNGLWAIVSSSK